MKITLVKKRNDKYMKLNMARYVARTNGNYELAEELLKQMRKIPSQISENDEYVRVNYVRYADDSVPRMRGQVA